MKFASYPLLLILLVHQVKAFLAPNRFVSRCVENELLVLQAKKKRRRRKGAPTSSGTDDTTKQSISNTPKNLEKDPLTTLYEASAVDPSEIDMDTVKDVANFEFDPDNSILKDFDQKKKDGLFVLPDIKDALRKKKIQEGIAILEEEERRAKPKIDRNDKAAYVKLLQSNPYADADDDYFVEREYNVISALLGERAELFLGIPTGPIQVGHFIGVLVIILMAYVEYPGFPLTNLPTPLRESFRGGLATVYSINAILAVLSIFKASARGQPVPLWMAKTFTVGGLAFDQLNQLPTLEETAKLKAQQQPKKGSQKRKTR